MARPRTLVPMRMISAFTTLVGAAAGLATAVAGYQHVQAAPVGGPPETSTIVPAVGRPLPAAPPQVKHRWAPCEGEAVLRHGACVTTVHRTVVVPVVRPAPAAPAPAAPAATHRVLPAAGSGTPHSDDVAEPAPEPEHVTEPEHGDDGYDDE